MLISWPVVATAPAMPELAGMRICCLVPWASRLHSSPVSRSRMNSEHRSASTTLVASVRMTGKSVSRSRDEVRRLRQQLEERLGREVRRIMITHAHFDHSGGLHLYPSAGSVLVHPNTRARLEKDGVRAPFAEVSDQVQLTLGAETVQVRY